MEKDRLSREEIINANHGDVEKLIPFLPWLQSKTGTSVSTNYGENGVRESSVTFPVYDSTLLTFVKTAKKTKFINRNYVYVYTKHHIKNAKDELKAIQNASLQDMYILGGILSKYMIQGTTKGRVWSEGVENGVYLKLILKMKELMEFWDKPMT